MAFLFAIAMASFIASDITMPPDSEKKRRVRARIFDIRVSCWERFVASWCLEVPGPTKTLAEL